MNRRGHLSHKIPNVKLRPAPASAAPTSSTSTRKGKQRDISPEVWREAYEDGEDEDASRGDVAGTSRPWESVVITFTGVDDKVGLSQGEIKLWLIRSNVDSICSRFWPIW